MLPKFDRLDVFHRGLGELVESCSRLDVTTCWHLASWKQIDESGVRAILKKSVSFSDRLVKLRSLCNAASEGIGDNECRAMERWFAELAGVRQQRNEFSHGRWITPPNPGPDGLQIQFVSLEQALSGSSDIVMVKLTELDELTRVARRLTAECHEVLDPFLYHAIQIKRQRDLGAGARRTVANNGGLSR